MIVVAATTAGGAIVAASSSAETPESMSALALLLAALASGLGGFTIVALLHDPSRRLAHVARSALMIWLVSGLNLLFVESVSLASWSASGVIIIVLALSAVVVSNLLARRPSRQRTLFLDSDRPTAWTTLGRWVGAIAAGTLATLIATAIASELAAR
jgi:hypothetical protein